MVLKFNIGDYVVPKRNNRGVPSKRIVAYGYNRHKHFSYWLLEDGSMLLTAKEDEYKSVKS